MLCNISQNAMGQTPGGIPIFHNALQHFPECHGADTYGGVPARSGQGGVPCWGDPGRVPPWQGTPQPGQDGGYPDRLPPRQVPPKGQDRGGNLPGGTHLGYLPSRVPPCARSGQGYPVRTTEGVVTTQRVVCLLHSCRRTDVHVGFVCDRPFSY